MPSVRPNFFIVGAPKCGTTALYHALRQHPEIFLPGAEGPHRYWIEKEPLYFCDDLDIADWVRVSQLEDYLALFANAGDAKRIGEASALYLLSASAPRRIQEFAAEDVRILILLRPPVDWMRSWHHDCLTYAHETIGDFSEALAAEADRAAGRRIPKTSGYPGCLHYRKAARFSDHVTRYFETFGRERVRVFLMEDLNRNPLGMVSDIFDFLDVSTDFQPVIERRNDSKVLTRTHLWEFRLGRKLGSMQRAKQFLDRIPAQPLDWYRRAMLRLAPPLSDKRIDPNLRKRLVEEFRPEVERLSALLGRDLSHWNEVASVPAA
ncbi:MAG: sulfotransferase domain-containing protein [Verrucomicrobiae bacterium]|nr:sulfotransferase domain-containing protein [Verrucomicrobiae bacterium]